MTPPADADLKTIPGIGPSMAIDLQELGVKQVGDLVGSDPQDLYDRLRGLRGGTMDRCVLYAFRCAVYYASTARPDPERLKWWNWKDRFESGSAAKRTVPGPSRRAR